MLREEGAFLRGFSRRCPEVVGYFPKASPDSGKSSSVSGDSGVLDDRSLTEKKQSDGDQQAQERINGVESRQPHAGVSSVLQQLEQLIISDDWVAKGHPHNAVASAASSSGKTRSHSEGPRLSELGRTLITSSSLKAYIDLLGAQHRQSIAAWLYGNTSQTLSNLFHLPSGNLYCSDADSSLTNSLKSGIGYAVRLALRDRYGVERLAHGWKAFVEMGPPVVYVSPAVHLDLGTYLATEFAISDVVQLPKLDGDLSEVEGRIDLVAFEKQLDADIAAGKLPLLVVGVVGSPILGQNDVISRLLELRKAKNGFWIHVVGQAIAGLALKEPNKVLVDILSQVDSFTFPLAMWLGILAAPVITLYRSVEGHKPTYREKLDALPWWVAAQHLTSKKIVQTIENAYFLSKAMLKGLSTFSEIQILGIENAAEFANRVYKGQYSPLNVLIFKYKYDELQLSMKKRKDSKLSSSSSEEGNERNIGENGALADEKLAARDEEQKEAMEYADSLNCWLGQGLITECRQLGLQMIELRGGYGTAFRFCPLETAAANSTRVEHIQKFIGQLETTLNIVESTVAARKHFQELKSQYPSLRILPVQKWAGVGAVCYVPSIVKDTDPKDWNDKQRQQVSHLNLELVHSLRSIDSAFSSGECSLYGVSCVKFGMLSDQKDLNDLVHLVAERGKEIEQSQQYMDSLAEMIRQGIEAANEDLKKENDARLMQEGVMRQIPLMSSLVNWFSPLDKEIQNIKGRSFDLKTGQIHSTEMYYKRRLMTESAVTSQEPHQLGASGETAVTRTASGSQEQCPRKHVGQPSDELPEKIPNTEGMLLFRALADAVIDADVYDTLIEGDYRLGWEEKK
uniref:Pyridoxal-dependent decarboxylase domain-containing protein 1 n=1 Tax=Ascaris lumbricoides TaxID=6252 RepID=A0A9J2PE01_ASCLU